MLILWVDGHYLNLPVVESEGRLVAIVDVLKLTYATLEQVCKSTFLHFIFSEIKPLDERHGR